MPRFDEGIENSKLIKGNIVLMGNPSAYGEILAENLLVEDITRANLQTLISNSELVRGKYYRITNAVGSTLSLLVQALTANTLAEYAYNTANGETYKYDITADTAILEPNPIALGTANQLLGINAGATGQEYKTLNGTTNQVTVTHGVGGITLSLPQNIHTGATPTFAGQTLNSQNLYDTPHEIYAIGDSLTGSGVYISRLESNLGVDWNVNNEGIGGNTTTAMLARFQTDVLDQSNPEYVIIWGGVNDAVNSVLPNVIQNNLQQMYTLAKNQGLKVIALTIAPFKNSVSASTQDLANAALVNNWIINNAIDVDYTVDVYSLLNDPLDEGALLAIYNSGDNIHLSTAGYNAVADLIFSQVNFTPLLQTNFTNNGNSLLNGDLDISGVLRLSSKLGLQYGGIGDVGTPTNGQILIGNGLNFTLNTITGTTNQVVVTNSAGGITLSLPQNINSTATPRFANLGIGVNATTDYGVFINNGTIGSLAWGNSSAQGLLSWDTGLVKIRGINSNGIVLGSGGSDVLMINTSRNVFIQKGGTFTDIPSSQFTITSTTQGFLPPRMTTTQKNAIASPTAGLMVYDTTLNKLCVYTTAWEQVTSA